MIEAKIKELIDKKHIKWIQIHFTDIMGGLRTLHIPADRFLAKESILMDRPWDFAKWKNLT